MWIYWFQKSKRIRETYSLEIYIEPGEAIALNAGYLATEVLDIVENGMEILILDASATCHMPDVLEMPYRPPLRNGFEAQEKAHTYRLSSNTCLTGDVSVIIALKIQSKSETDFISKTWPFILLSK